MDEAEKEKFLHIESTMDLVKIFNDLTKAETTMENEEEERKGALLDHRMRIQDTLTFAKGRMLLESKHFAVYLYDRQRRSDYNAEADLKKIGNFLTSVLWINRVLGGAVNHRRDALTNTIKTRPSKGVQCELRPGVPDSPAPVDVQGKDDAGGPETRAESAAANQGIEELRREHGRQMGVALEELQKMQAVLDGAGIPYKSNAVLGLVRGALAAAVQRQLVDQRSSGDTQRPGSKFGK